MPPSAERFYDDLWAGAPPQILAEVEQSRNMLRYQGR